jgi:hypothetical protein
LPNEPLLGHLGAEITSNGSHVAVKEFDYCLPSSVESRHEEVKDLHHAAANAFVSFLKPSSDTHDWAIAL